MHVQSRYSLRRLDFPPNLFWQGTESEVCSKVLLEKSCSRPVSGQFAMVRKEIQSIELCRDRLGLNKLFYHVAVDSGLVTVGHYLHDVAEATGDANGVMSVPAGHFVRIDRETGSVQLSSYCDLSAIETDADFNASRFTSGLDRKLTEFFIQLDRQFPNGPFFVCLSGGLDSTMIASYARRHLQNVTAVTFSYESLSDDYQAARSIAAALDMPFRSVVAKRQMNDEMLNQVIQYCQDWRDFNVHCAWVNFQIAKQLRSELDRDPAIVLTGDLMNEFVADYSAEEFAGTVYYPLPNVSRGRLRRFLVYGLDSSDREMGIFHRWGFTLVQPFSILVNDYLTVPPELLDSEDVKRSLNLALVDQRATPHLLAKKTRAQVGSSDGGTLGLFHESGIGQAELLQRWQELLLPHAKESVLQPMIFSGRYRA